MRIAVIAVAEVMLQLGIAYWVSVHQPGWVVWTLMCYIISGTLNHSLGTAIHEIGHNLAFGHHHGPANRVLSLVCNLPMIIPVAVSYKKYRHDHHRWLGHEDLDVDVPMHIECRLFRSVPLRVVWILLNPLFYALRPFFKSPRPVTAWEGINLIVQSAFDVIAWHCLGNYAFAYLLMGTVIGFGPHPMAGHVISEHYLFADNLVTHSYYGPLNIPLFNAGYHVEHHDFPYIPFTRLHKLKELAPEFYNHLPYHSSLCKVMWDFVFMPGLGPEARSITTTLKSQPETYNKVPHFELTSALTFPDASKKAE
ncbi:Peptidase M neutral zinc metallopeptidases zinc binding site [Echinococcus multilocularis]|uniref:Peptidase M neutral zinc metallopeptidases zinc binding site n=1 Tax=Echinococcus multilocularis TaxID=6211 RepID=A0A068XVU3_ECHMU|nr:Peptidase M neutral zinc metallopeptidases zinc binding site [Echinococcus multilocularis]